MLQDHLIQKGGPSLNPPMSLESWRSFQRFNRLIFSLVYSIYWMFLEATVMVERESFPDPYYLRTLSVYSLDIQT
jgi:hypothetical protein